MSLAHDQAAGAPHMCSVVGSLAEGQPARAAQCTRALGDRLPGQSEYVAHLEPAGDILPPTNGTPRPNVFASAVDLASDHLSADDHNVCVAGDLDGSHARTATHARNAPVDLAEGQSSGAHQAPAALGDLETFHVQLNAAVLDDLEGVRKAVQNRLRAAEANGLPVIQYAAHLALLEQVEHQATLDLQRALRKHPLGGWVKATTGVGEKQGARLIAAIGDPYWNHAEDRPRRGPAELWAYCGYAPGQKRAKGVKSNWNAEAKMRAFLCAEAAVKAGVRKLPDCDDSSSYNVAHRTATSPLGACYLTARANWSERDTSDLHKHNHALRVVAKAILRDLFLEARVLHEDAA